MQEANVLVIKFSNEEVILTYPEPLTMELFQEIIKRKLVHATCSGAKEMQVTARLTLKT